ncbi:hypothetical protein Gotri_020331 [Gossypium trilobum]|uniref:RRM domain-containing protein n=1 Tax=Gossypium trilobum TaxID=34281 RepID=A0A7J9D987_9ROSI|nr:hypothetical protein [Gossypium trilobum]
MSSITKPISMADSCCLVCIPSLFITCSKSPSILSFPPKRINLLLSSSHSSTSLTLKTKTHFSSLVSFVAQTSDWAQQEEENDATITIDDEESGIEAKWENDESDGPEGEDAVFEEQSGDSEEEGSEPSEEAKLFVGNLPSDVDSQSLAMLFEKAGTVEIAEVIYNRDTEQSRGFGFVTMSSIEEAEKAVEQFNRYCQDLFRAVVKAPICHLDDTGSHDKKNYIWSALSYSISRYATNMSVEHTETGRSRGFGFVTMSSETELNDAIAALDGQSLDGRAIRVNVAEERPRRGFF